MRVLYIDTSSDYLYSGIVIDDKLVTEIKRKYEKDLSKEALPKVIELFDKAKITPKDLDKIIVVNGPGSFTGIRIGITIAKTIAWALNIKITPISGLTAMAISCAHIMNTYIVVSVDLHLVELFAGMIGGVELWSIVENLQTLDPSGPWKIFSKVIKTKGEKYLDITIDKNDLPKIKKLCKKIK